MKNLAWFIRNERALRRHDLRIRLIGVGLMQVPASQGFGEGLGMAV